MAILHILSVAPFCYRMDSIYSMNPIHQTGRCHCCFDATFDKIKLQPRVAEMQTQVGGVSDTHALR
jgi:hypothetical protein